MLIETLDEFKKYVYETDNMSVVKSLAIYWKTRYELVKKYPIKERVTADENT